MRQAIAAAMDFGKVGVLKLPAPRSEAGKVGSINICLVGNAQLIQTSPGLQGAGAGSGVRAGPESCVLSAWSWGWRADLACAEMAMAHGYLQTLGFVSLPAGMVQSYLPALAADPRTSYLQAAVAAACAMLPWQTDHHSAPRHWGAGSPGHGLSG